MLLHFNYTPLESCRDKLQEYTMKNRVFYLRNLIKSDFHITSKRQFKVKPVKSSYGSLENIQALSVTFFDENHIFQNISTPDLFVTPSVSN